MTKQYFKIVSRNGSVRMVEGKPGQTIPIKRTDTVIPVVIVDPVWPKTFTISIGNAHSIS